MSIIFAISTSNNLYQLNLCMREVAYLGLIFTICACLIIEIQQIYLQSKFIFGFFGTNSWVYGGFVINI